MTLLRKTLIGDINLTYQARVPKSEPTDNARPNGSRLSCGALKKDSFHNLRAPTASSAC